IEANEPSSGNGLRRPRSAVPDGGILTPKNDGKARSFLPGKGRSTEMAPTSATELGPRFGVANLSRFVPFVPTYPTEKRKSLHNSLSKVSPQCCAYGVSRWAFGKMNPGPVVRLVRKAAARMPSTGSPNAP